MLLAHVMLACVVAVSGQDGAALPAQGAAVPAAQSEQGASAADVVSLERIRKALEQAGIADEFRISPRKNIPTFRVQIFGFERKPITFEDSLKEYLAQPSPPVDGSFFDSYPGPRRAGAGPPAGLAVPVDPLFLVHAIQDWSYRRAVAKAKAEVEAELQALLAANKKRAAEK